MRKFTESLSSIKKEEGKQIRYYNLFPLLRGLESERPGIKDRVWAHIKDEFDVASKPYNGRISNINLFFYGIGDEYETKYLSEYPDELEHCKKIHPEAFTEGTKEYDLRLDFNLIIHVYQDDFKDFNYIEEFSVLVNW